jgi:hypothetical protein
MYDWRHPARADPERLQTRLRQEADAALTVGPFSVMDKPLVPPSGDKHDYMSFGPYWWPNPDTPDGLPYIRRDGEVNPQRDTLDNKPLRTMLDAVKTLTLAAETFQEKQYAERAVLLLHEWFVYDDTRMNPHLEYAQAIPGVCDGRGIGIIDVAEPFADLTESLERLEHLPHAWHCWDHCDMVDMYGWLLDYLEWLQNSEKGKDEARQHNNHGTWYDVHVVALAIFFRGDNKLQEMARQTLNEAVNRRIRAHVQPDGSQPHELARTRSYSYSVMNLRGLMRLAHYSERFGLPLWQVALANDLDGDPLLLRALHFLLPAALGEAEWTYSQITPFDAPAALYPLVLHAADAYPDSGLDTAAERIALLLPDV